MTQVPKYLLLQNGLHFPSSAAGAHGLTQHCLARVSWSLLSNYGSTLNPISLQLSQCQKPPHTSHFGESISRGS